MEPGWVLSAPDGPHVGPMNLVISVVDIIKSSPPSATYMRQWTGYVLVHIMACRLFGARPLSKQMRDLLSIGALRTNLSEILI